MSAEEIKDALVDAVKEVMPKAVKDAMGEASGCRGCCQTCELEPNQHRDDHKFVYELRQTLTDGRKTMLATFFKTLAVAIILGVCALVMIKGGMTH